MIEHLLTNEDELGYKVKKFCELCPRVCNQSK